MQKITYVNTLGESIEFSGALPYIFVSVKGTENTEADLQTMQGAFQDGKRTVAALREDRTLTVTFNLITYGRREMYRVRAEMCSMLAVEKGFNRLTGARGKIIYENDFGAWWTWGMPRTMPEWPKRLNDLHANVKMTFDCDSPYWFGMEEKRAGFGAKREGFRLPFSFPIQFAARETEMTLLNEGHAPAPVRLEVHGEGERPVIRNRTTGQAIRFTEPLPVGTVLFIQTDPDDLSVVLRSGNTEENAYGYLDVTTPVSDFTLAPGENLISYESDAPSSMTRVALSWRERFEGV